MNIYRAWAMPSGNTFSIPPIKELVEKQIHTKSVGVIVDMFANTSKYGTITNDLNPEYDTMFHLDALEFMKMQGKEIADIVLFDPPYSITQASQLYRNYGKEKLQVSVSNMKYWADLKDECARVCKIGGVVISCGWNTNGLGSGRGFDLEDVLVVAHGGGHNDTLVTVERKLTHQIDIFETLEKWV